MLRITQILIPTKLSDFKKILERCKESIHIQRMYEMSTKKGYIRLDDGRYYPVDPNGCISHYYDGGFATKEDALSSVRPSQK